MKINSNLIKKVIEDLVDEQVYSNKALVKDATKAILNVYRQEGRLNEEVDFEDFEEELIHMVEYRVEDDRFIMQMVILGDFFEDFEECRNGLSNREIDIIESLIDKYFHNQQKSEKEIADRAFLEMWLKSGIIEEYKNNRENMSPDKAKFAEYLIRLFNPSI